MPDSPWDRLLHLHAQGCWHDTAYVVGNRVALVALRDAIDTALASEVEACVPVEALTVDGEGYTVVVQFVPADFDDEPRWVLPYTEDFARGSRDGVEYPFQRESSS